ncbi:helix-turn-helix transcriptional regulator [Erwinia aphidicola]|jgi:Ner family transcriptional regulator|uniref:helix-turn-helix domain-containing protein n=1 Tax=Erwinia aphidicola TaxID=68334 RepID=UPI000C179A91|nr:helix-turn-helix transcriptional regulator [Erwinia aphidicola]MBD1376188.1 helix-turn-helix domain-containing protein [Erwinia aphidicola]MCP2230626.1 Ner family transcriptional regulator [Erwinia aphidicola]PIJ56189.1 sugar fermentation stimulation protein [Erwinia sp. OLMDLW33]
MKRKDMHPADIIAAFKKKGISLAQLSRQVGLSSGTLGNALKRPWPKGEFIIAGALGKHPADIWPTRYYDRRGRLLPRENLIRRQRSVATDRAEDEDITAP